MTNVPPPRLAALLRDQAKGYYATEAAAELLIAHGTWLHRTDFLDACVVAIDAAGNDLGSPRHPAGTVTRAGIAWDDIPAFADTAPCSGSEARILRLVAELAGTDTATPLGELLSSLDGRNSALVLDAIAHTLNTQLWTGEPVQ